MNETYRADVAPTSRAKCRGCRDQIAKGTPRVWYNGMIEKEVKARDGRKIMIKIMDKKIYCYRCAMNRLKIEERFRLMLIHDIRKIKKKFTRMMHGKRAKTAMVKESILREL